MLIAISILIILIGCIITSAVLSTLFMSKSKQIKEEPVEDYKIM